MCYVKSQASSEILLQCRVGKDGLYEFPHLQLIQPPKSSQVSCLALALSIPASSLNSSTGTRFSNSNQNVSESNSCNSHLTWHLRLGHPNPHTMKLVLEQCNISFSNKANSMFCSACCMGKAH